MSLIQGSTFISLKFILNAYYPPVSFAALCCFLP